jgi:SH3-like domain-containing protein
MLKIKIAAALLLAIIAGGYTASKTASQTRSGTKDSVSTKSSAAVEKSRTKCSVKAYRAGFASDEPKNSVVRAQPDKNAAILKSVSTKDEVVFYISGSNGSGWFEISKIETTGGDVDVILFQGRGWIHSSLVEMSIGGSDAKLYAAPRKKSRVLKKLVVDESEARPVACQGDWMQVKSGKLTGWLSPEGQCANPLTTCS